MTAVVILISCTLILRAVDASLAPPGELHWVDGDRYLMHVYCKGDTTDDKGRKLPTVLIEGGEGTVEDSLWQFTDDAVKNGSITRYCFVDRPGVAWVCRRSKACHKRGLIADIYEERHRTISTFGRHGSRGDQ